MKSTPKVEVAKILASELVTILEDCVDLKNTKSHQLKFLMVSGRTQETVVVVVCLGGDASRAMLEFCDGQVDRGIARVKELET